MRASLAAWVMAGLAVTGCDVQSKCDSDVPCSAADGPHGASVAKSALARSSTPSDANVGALGAGNRAFAFDLYQHVSEGQTGNLVLSPYSISTALAMTYAGARGSTESEMKQALHFTLEQTPLHEAFNATELSFSRRATPPSQPELRPFQLRVDNSLWAQRGFEIVPAFLDTLAVNYGAGVFLTDFAANPEASRLAINDWVSERTEALIPELLGADAVGRDTVFVLTNTVYFEASWRSRLPKALSANETFTRADNSQVGVSMMHDTQLMPYAEGPDYQAVALPYASEGLSWIAVLPAAGKFEAVERGLNSAWFDQLAWSDHSVILAVPKFDYRSSFELADALKALGMNAAFAGADFSGLSKSPVVIEDVIHEAVMRLDEEGTVAAAATAVVGRGVSKPSDQKTVSFDRPFLHLIFDRQTGSILFLGRVLDPSAH